MKPVIALVALWSALARADDHRLLWMQNVHTGETVRLQPFGQDGLIKRIDWLRMRRFFRSWRTGASRPVSPRLLRILAQVQSHFGGQRIDLLSGYRQPQSRDRLTSYHQTGAAGDIFIKGISEKETFRYCRSLDRVGCGAYPNGHHCHVDPRSIKTLWVDLSHYGDGADYVRDAGAWIRQNDW